jgi:guanylate kinase
VILKQHPGLVFVLVGPGGAGKNALLRNILERTDNLTQLATATTRAARGGEQHGKQRLFVTHEEFKRMIAQNELVEHEEVHTGDFYGVPRVSIEGPIAADQDLIADIDMHGGQSLRAEYPNNIILIFIAPPGEGTEEMMAVLKQRLRTRAATDEQIEQRLRRAPEEFEFASECDYIVVNDDINLATEVLHGIIYAERSRRNVLNLRAVENQPMSVSAIRHQLLRSTTERYFALVMQKIT